MSDSENELEICDLNLYRSSRSDITVTLGKDADFLDAANIIISGNFKVNMGSGRDTAQAFDIISADDLTSGAAMPRVKVAIETMDIYRLDREVGAP